ncbi:MAG: acyl--CoA ligase [Deltaproteobacteria bacterium]|nr:acyl--CoA ligase [Deltaproteobacteria bacterium]MBW2383552.1 acyl--CoA ligase [Deltaproteobacteria bacterium]
MSDAPALLIGDLIARNAAQVPDRVAAWLGGAAITHAELDTRANALAWALSEAGIGHGDRVLSWAGTCLDVMPLFAALAKLGAVFAPLNALYGIEEALSVARLARAKILISDAEHAEAAVELAARAAIPQRARLQAGGPAAGDLDLAAVASAGGRPAYREPALQESDPHVLFFTSGSTGAPKGVVLSHRANYLRSFQGVFLTEPERSVCMFPLFHMAGFTLALCAWQTRGEIAFVSSATADELLSAVQARSANRLYCIPAVWSRLLEVAPDRYDTSSLRVVDTGTSATPPALLDALKARFPDAWVRVFYGSTECGSGTILEDADVLRKPGSVGLPSPGVELKLAEGGEVCLRSAYQMDGYFDAPETTAEVLRDGWYHTGDVGSLDEEGYLSIVGRIKDIIRTGGESFAPSEVEDVLVGHPAVAEVAVVGLPDAEWGELVCAVVVAADDGPRPTLSDLQAHCAGSLAGYKKPRRIEVVDALPRTPATGQVQRVLLIEQILSR